MKALLLALAVTASAAQAGPGPATDSVYAAMTQDSRWLNVSRALTPEDLLGRVIVLDFWTYCCINCMHVLPELHRLEAAFGPKLTVIGVHSAKFQNEKDTRNIRDAILRYGVTHPVVNDSDFKVWRNFGVQAWPTLVVIDPDGKVANEYSGEGHFDELKADVEELLKRFGSKVNVSPLPIALEREHAAPGVLDFPGKIAYDPDDRLLFVADSSHHRILGLKLQKTVQGKVKVVIGAQGIPGRDDGSFSDARFTRPQGLFYRGHHLYVADTENGLVRDVDLKERKVRTIAGAQGELSSPWALAAVPGSASAIAVAVAGRHRLVALDPATGAERILAGDGREAIVDGEFPSNSLAQTSGLSAWGGKLYFVDAESSSLRVLDGKRVTTLIGSGLFDFGFKDGKLGTARLQHPLGVYADASGIYVADSYNHAIRRFDLKTRELTTFAGDGQPGLRDDVGRAARFHEPSGLTRALGALYVADTDNNAIRRIDLKTRKVSTLQLDTPRARRANAPVSLAAFLPKLRKRGLAQVAAGSAVAFDLKFDSGWHLNAIAPSWAALFEEKGGDWAPVRAFDRAALASTGKAAPKLPELQSGRKYRLRGTFYFCRAGKGALCYLQSEDFPIEARAGGASALVVPLTSARK